MLLRSNIGSMISRLERFQAGVPDAVSKAIAPKYWKERLERVAAVTIRAQWALERNVQTRALYERVTARILKSMTGEMANALATYSLSLDLVAQGQVAEGLDIAAAAEYNLGTRTPSGRPARYAIQEQGQDANLEATKQAILDWVKLEKRRTDKDAGLTDEEIARRLEEILGISDRAVPRERTPVMEEAAQGLVGAIQEWLAGEGESPPTKPGDGLPSRQQIDGQVIESWFTAVMLAWRAYVQDHLRDRVEMELAKLYRQLAPLGGTFSGRPSWWRRAFSK